MTSVHRAISADVAGLGARLPAPVGGEEVQHRVTEPCGPFQRVGSPDERLFEHGRRHQRIRHVVEHPDDDRVVAGRIRDRQRLVGQRLPAFERAPDDDLEAVGGEDQRPVRIVRRHRSSAASKIATRSLSIAPKLLNSPRCAASAAATSRGVSPSVDRLASRAEQGLTECRQSDLTLGGAEADREVDFEHGVAGSRLGDEIERLGSTRERVRWARARRARRRRLVASTRSP